MNLVVFLFQESLTLGRKFLDEGEFLDMLMILDKLKNLDLAANHNKLYLQFQVV